MKRFRQKLPEKCLQIQDLLIKNQFEEISDLEKKTINLHLESCVECRHYRSIVKRMKMELAHDEEISISSHPLTKHILLERFKVVKGKNKSKFPEIVNQIKTAFSYRIPVYQIALAAFFFLLLMFSVQRFSVPFGQGKTQGSSVNFLADSTSYQQLNVIKDPDILTQQKLGRTIHEDSVLTSFIARTL